ncbi:hypothetical protein E4U53_004297 [Claviceps sorghi]|nr:hypothetical protein E4U53_004297 [Claviceps sorghi]
MTLKPSQAAAKEITGVTAIAKGLIAPSNPSTLNVMSTTQTPQGNQEPVDRNDGDVCWRCEQATATNRFQGPANRRQVQIAFDSSDEWHRLTPRPEKAPQDGGDAGSRAFQTLAMLVLAVPRRARARSVARSIHAAGGSMADVSVLSCLVLRMKLSGACQASLLRT